MISVKKKICMIAHRGFSSAYPENTELAFIKGAENGSGGAETDVRVTKDGFFVLSHNGDAVFADGTSLPVSESTLAQLTEKPLFNKRGSDTVYICTLQRYLEIMKENGMVCFIELKGEFSREQIHRVYDLIADVYDLSKCIVQSFDFNNLLLSREYIPDLPIMLTYGQGEVALGFERCFDGNFSIDMDYHLINDDVIEQFHIRGLEVALWTVNDADDFARCCRMDVDYIESDVFGRTVD